jgi:hypothetical protein
MNRILDVVEKDAQPEQKTEFFAQIISGEETTDTTTQGWFDSFFSDVAGVPTAKFKIRFINEDEQRNRHEDPYGESIAEDIRKMLVSLHEDAYFEPTAGIATPPAPGSTVIVRKHNDVYKIIKIIGTGASVGDNQSTKGTKKKFQSKAARLKGDMAKNQGTPQKLEKRKINPPQEIIELLYTSFGKTMADFKEDSVAFFGVRTAKTNYNHFKDKMIAAVKKGQTFNFYSFTITTTPGTAFLGNLKYHRDGTLNLASPQYIKGAFQLVYHKQEYLALGQAAPFYFWRDNNRNNKADDKPMTNVTLKKEAGKGVNVHKSGKSNNPKPTKPISRTSGGSKEINAYEYKNGKWIKIKTRAYTYSAGCQVFTDQQDFWNFMELIKEDTRKNNVKLWDYFIIDEGDYSALKSKKSIKDSIEKKQKEKGIVQQ